MSIDHATFIDCCNDIRADLLLIEMRIRELTPHVSLLDDCADIPEVNANLMLAVRHSEDSRMRVGKAIQHSNGGISRYDQESSP